MSPRLIGLRSRRRSDRNRDPGVFIAFNSLLGGGIVGLLCVVDCRLNYSFFDFRAILASFDSTRKMFAFMKCVSIVQKGRGGRLVNPEEDWIVKNVVNLILLKRIECWKKSDAIDYLGGIGERKTVSISCPLMTRKNWEEQVSLVCLVCKLPINILQIIHETFENEP